MRRPPVSPFFVVWLAAAGCGDEAPVSTLHEPGSEIQVRPDTPGNSRMFSFDATDVVVTHGSPGGDFLIHYTLTEGANDVPAADADASGVPDFVEQVAEVYDEVGVFYEEELGFRRPLDDGFIADNGGDARFDVYLVDFAGVGDGNYRNDQCLADNPSRCAGYIVQENDYAGYGYPSTAIANRILGSHEYFHAVQAAYDTGQGSVAAEGSAVWATERFDSSLSDFEGFIDGYLQNPDRSLDVPLPGPVDPFSYGAGIFFQFLAERFGDEAVEQLWARSEDGAEGVADPMWLTVLDPLLVDLAGSTFAEAFREFATWNLYTASYADPGVAYAEGVGYGLVAIEMVGLPYADPELRVFYASTQYVGMLPDGRPEMTVALVAPPDAPQELEDLSVVVALDQGGTWGAVTTLADLSAGEETFDTSGVVRLVVAVVNGATSGDSRRPGLCIGTPEEVVACKASLGVTPEPPVDPGTGGSATEPPGETAPPADDGCGCEVPGQPSAGSPWLLGLGLAGCLSLSRRRRRASEKASTRP